MRKFRWYTKWYEVRAACDCCTEYEEEFILLDEDDITVGVYDSYDEMLLALLGQYNISLEVYDETATH